MSKKIGFMLVLVCLIFAIRAELIPLEAYTSPYRVFGMEATEDSLWIATWGGLVRYNKESGEREVFNTVNSGLLSNHISAVKMSSAGELLVGTMLNIVDEDNSNYGVAGLNIRYTDGTWESFTIYNSALPFPSVSSLAIDEEGNRWIGTLGGGLAKWIPEGDWEIYHCGNSNLPNNYVRSLWLDNEGTLWIGCLSTSNAEGGLACVTDGEIINLTSELPETEADLDIMSFTQTPDGTIWIAANYSDYFSLDEEGFSHHIVPEIEPGSLYGPAVRTINCLNDGTLVMGTNDGITFWDGENWSLYNNNNSVVGEYNINAIIADADDVIWFGSTFGGLYRAEDFSFTECPIWSEDHSIQCWEIYDIECDESGSVWIAAADNMTNNGIGGLSYLVDGEWGLVDYEVTTDFLYNDIYLAEGTVFCATGNQHDIGGVIYGDPMGWERYDFYSTNGEFPYCSADDVTFTQGGSIWASRNNITGGISIFDGSEFYQIDSGNSGLLTNSIYCLEADCFLDNVVWVGGAAGLQKVTQTDEFSFENYHPGNTTLTSAEITDLSFDSNGTLWVATTSGVSSFDGHNWVSWNEYIPMNGGYPEAIWDIYCDQEDRVWCATFSGIVCLYEGTGITYTSEEIGLPTLGIEELAVDANGDLWVGTYCSGVYCYEIIAESAAEEVILNKPVIDHGNYPNPFNPSTTISFALQTAASIEVAVYDIKGRKIKTLHNAYLASGKHSLIWDGFDSVNRAAASGIYFYRITGENISAAGKMILMK